MSESPYAVRLRQGRAWIERLAELEGWPSARKDEALRELDAWPDHELDRVVEGYRAAMQHATEAAGAVPAFARSMPGGQIDHQAGKRKPRGLARHLYRASTLSVPAEPAKHEARARDSPRVVADPPDDDDPYRIVCCESCAHWCRHPESGAGLCMAEPSTADAMTARRAWLAAGNALCRCPDFLRRRVVS